jgi:beta-glucosidase-like glycosyl hydrolase
MVIRSSLRGASWPSTPSVAHHRASGSLGVSAAPIAVAATSDEPLVHRVTGLLAAEAHSKGVAAVPAPMMNLQRSPLAGPSV